MPLTQQDHYIVGYHDTQRQHHDPHFIDYCTKELPEIDKITHLMAAGIPMGH